MEVDCCHQLQWFEGENIWMELQLRRQNQHYLDILHGKLEASQKQSFNCSAKLVTAHAQLTHWVPLNVPSLFLSD